MEPGIAKLEDWSVSTDPVNVESLFVEYKRLYPDQPVWQLVQDIQQQAMVYANIIERLKAGESAADIRARFEYLDLMPKRKLPNPNANQLLQTALDRLTQFRVAIVKIIRQYGGRLLEELSVETGLTVGVGANIGFVPSVELSIEYEAKAELRWRN